MPDPLRAVVFAYSEVGHACLKELLRQGTTVQAVFTHEDDPAETRWFPSVAELARDADIPLFFPDSLGDGEFRSVELLRPDTIFSFYYRSMIPERFLALAPKGAFNMHGSLLPKYRGRACVNWAILNGESETGATLHYMVKRADAGDIVDQEAVPILFEESALDVSRKVAEASRSILERTLPRIADGTASRTPQNEEEATYFGRRTPADGLIDWGETAVRIHNLVRAVTRPFPGAFTFHSGRKLFVWRTTVETELPFSEARPGTVLSTDPFRVASGLDVVRILEWLYEGENEDIRTDAGEAATIKGEILGKNVSVPAEHESEESPS